MSGSSNSPPVGPERAYAPEPGLEDFELYRVGGYHPTAVGDFFHNGRYEVVGKLGWGSYSTVWLAQDKEKDHYVALKIMVASKTSTSKEAEILRLLHSGSDSPRMGEAHIPLLLDDFVFEGPNGRHICLVFHPATCGIAESKKKGENPLFPAETARSIAAQLIQGLFYMHSHGVCHGDLQVNNILAHAFAFYYLSPDGVKDRYALEPTEMNQLDDASPGPHAPAVGFGRLPTAIPADKLVDPRIEIADYSTAFIVTDDDTQPPPELRTVTPNIYRPPESFFNEPPTLASDVWTLGTALYEILGRGSHLFDSQSGDPDEVLAEMVSALGGPLPTRWWNKWEARGDFFTQKGAWKRRGVSKADTSKTKTKHVSSGGVSRPLQQRLWEMGRGETPETCEWDVEGGEMKALEEMLRGMLAYEPSKRWTAQDLVNCEYVVKWAEPALERQLKRMGQRAPPKGGINTVFDGVFWCATMRATAAKTTGDSDVSKVSPKGRDQPQAESTRPRKRARVKP